MSAGLRTPCKCVAERAKVSHLVIRQGFVASHFWRYVWYRRRRPGAALLLLLLAHCELGAGYLFELTALPAS